MRGIFFGLMFFAITLSQICQGQPLATTVSYASKDSMYTQNFDGLPSNGSYLLNGKGPLWLSNPPINATNLLGWQFLLLAGNTTNANFAISTGSATGQGVYSLGSTASTDRALGSLASGTGLYAFGLILTNNTGAFLNKCSISFTAEQWRKGGSANKNSWTFRYKTGSLVTLDQPDFITITQLNFNSVINTLSAASLNGNLPENQLQVSYTIDSLHWLPGQQLVLRWDDIDESGSDDACGIDNFQFSASVVSNLPSVITFPASNIGATSATLHGIVNDNNATTNAGFEYDSITTLVHPIYLPAIPDTLSAGIGDIAVTKNITGLQPGKNYYFRAKATNQKGSTSGQIQNFTTTLPPAIVITSPVVAISKSSAQVGGSVTQPAGIAILEKGIVWSINPNPQITDTKRMLGNDTGNFSAVIDQLPEGKTIYVKAYAMNQGGIYYGNEVVYTTYTSVTSFNSITHLKTKDQSVQFRLQTAQHITGLSMDNFTLLTTEIKDAAITSITDSANTFIITVFTGTGDGTIGLTITNSLGLSAPIYGTPITTSELYTIDKSAPVIRSISIPNQPMKLGDTIAVSIIVLPDSDSLQLNNGYINNYPLTSWNKCNDSCYTALFIISVAGNDISASATIPVSIQLSDAIGNTSDPYQIPINQLADLIDASKPFVQSIRYPENQLYKFGDTLIFCFQFNEKIKITNDSPSINLTIGSKVKSAIYSFGNETDSLLFTYIIQIGDFDKDGIKIGHTIQLNTSIISDEVGNTLLPQFSTSAVTRAITIDAILPKISSVITPIAGKYQTGDTLRFTINFSEKVNILIKDSIPFLQVKIGSILQRVFYQSGSGSQSLQFNYIIHATDFTKEILKLTDSLFLMNATLKDDAGNHASVWLNNIGALSGIKINPVTATINRITIPVNGLYKTGDTLTFFVQYSEKIFVDTTNGLPQLTLTIGKTTQLANYKMGSGSNTLYFSYTIKQGMLDTNGIQLKNTISLQNSIISDSMNRAVPITFNNVTLTDSIFIDAISPEVKEIIFPKEFIYKFSDTLTFIVKFSENIQVVIKENAPSLQLIIGEKVRSATYKLGGMSDSLVFAYIVQKDDLDKTGIKITNALQLNGSAITDIPGNNVAVSFNKSISTKSIYIDAIPAAVTRVKIPITANYKTGNLLDFLVYFSENVFITAGESPPYILLNIGSNKRMAIYQTGNGGNALLFRYSIQEDDFDKDGIEISDATIQNVAQIKDEAGNPTLPALTNMNVLSGISINPVTAMVSSVLVPMHKVYKKGDKLDFIVLYTEEIQVDTSNGIPSIKLTIGNLTKQAKFNYKKGTNGIVFTYTVESGDETTNGILVNASISTNKATISDLRNNPAPTILHTIENTNGILIDAIAPVITNIIAPKNRIYMEGDTLIFRFQFSENVSFRIGTTPAAVQVTIGTNQKYLKYTETLFNNQLVFAYIVEKGDLDKNGIRLGNTLLLYTNQLTDLAGNDAAITIKKSGVFLEVKIDAVAPIFVIENTSAIFLCQNSSAISLDSFLVIKDEESNEQINWQIISTTYHGSITNNQCTLASNGKTVLPKGFIFIPIDNHYGNDTILVSVSDGTNTNEKKLIISLQRRLQPTIIGPAQIICTNQTPALITSQNTAENGNSPLYRWETATLDDSSNFKQAPGIANLEGYHTIPLIDHTWFRRITSLGVCSDTSSPIKITVLHEGLWLAKNDTKWNNKYNWCNLSIPTKATDVRVYANAIYYPVIENDTANCHDLFIEEKAYVTILGKLTMLGNLSPSQGLFKAEEGTLVLAGNEKQTLSGNHFKDHILGNLICQNNEGIIVADSLEIRGTLTLHKGEINTADQLYLQKNAVIGASATGTLIKGNISLEHEIEGGKKRFLLLGHPFGLDTGLQFITKYIDITGTGGMMNGFTNSATNQPSAFRHDANLGNDSLGIEAGWKSFTNTNGQQENSWKKYSGIRLLMSGKPGQGLDGKPAGNGLYGTYYPEPVLLKLSGRVNTGDQEISFHDEKAGGYHVIANPYPSPINLSRIMYGSAIGHNYWIWDPQQAKMGGYSSLPFSTNYILPAFGAFIVKVNNLSNQHILITEDGKTTEAAQDNLPIIEMDNAYHLELRLETDGIFWDRILLIAMDSAKTYFDKNDAEKLTNTDVNFYSLSKEKKLLSIDARPISNESIIPLGIQTKVPGEFRIRVAKGYLLGSNKLMLHDRLLQAWLPLETDSSYSFTIANEALNGSNDRFEIISQKQYEESLISTSTLKIKLSPNPAKNVLQIKFTSPEFANTAIRLLTLSGTPVKNISLGMQKEGQVTMPIGDLINGVYFVELRSGYQQKTMKIIKN